MTAAKQTEDAAVAALAWLWFGFHYLWRSIPSFVCVCVWVGHGRSPTFFSFLLLISTVCHSLSGISKSLA